MERLHRQMRGYFKRFQEGQEEFKRMKQKVEQQINESMKESEISGKVATGFVFPKSLVKTKEDCKISALESPLKRLKALHDKHGETTGCLVCQRLRGRVRLNHCKRKQIAWEATDCCSPSQVSSIDEPITTPKSEQRRSITGNRPLEPTQEEIDDESDARNQTPPPSSKRSFEEQAKDADEEEAQRLRPEDASTNVAAVGNTLQSLDEHIFGIAFEPQDFHLQISKDQKVACEKGIERLIAGTGAPICDDGDLQDSDETVLVQKPAPKAMPKGKPAPKAMPKGKLLKVQKKLKPTPKLRPWHRKEDSVTDSSAEGISLASECWQKKQSIKKTLVQSVCQEEEEPDDDLQLAILR